MRRVLPDELLPLPSAMLAMAPRVQPTVTAPVPSRFADASATTGSQVPKARALVLIVQFLPTVAATPKLAVDVAALACGARPLVSEIVAATTPTVRTSDFFSIAINTLSVRLKPDSP